MSKVASALLCYPVEAVPVEHRMEPQVRTQRLTLRTVHVFCLPRFDNLERLGPLFRVLREVQGNFGGPISVEAHCASIAKVW